MGFYSKRRAGAGRATAAVAAAAGRAVEVLEDRRLMAATIYDLGGGTPTSASTYAGLALHLQALGASTSNGDVSAKYEWNFGDANPDGSPKPHSVLPGFNAAYVYDTPGTRTVTLKVTAADGTTTTDTLSVNVQGTGGFDQIYVDPAGSDTNSGADPANPVRSFNKVNSLMGGYAAASGYVGMKVHFKRGATFERSNAAYIDAKYDNTIIDAAFGTGAKPMLRDTSTTGSTALIMSNTGTSGLTVQDLAFDDAQPVTVTNADGTTKQSTPAALSVRGGQNVALRNADLHNLGSGLVAEATYHANGLLAQGNRTVLSTGIYDNLAFVSGQNIVVVGNTATNSRQEHNVRVMNAGGTTPTTTRVLIAGNDFRNTNSGKETITARFGNNIYIADNVTRGGGRVQVGDGQTGKPEHVVLERNVHEETGSTAIGIWLRDADHVMLRNNVVKLTSTYDRGGIVITGLNGNVSDVTLANNTIINGTTVRAAIEVEGSAVSGVRLLNNLHTAPEPVNGTGGFNDYSVIGTAGAGAAEFAAVDGNVWTPRGTNATDPVVARLTSSTGTVTDHTLSSWNAVTAPGTGADTVETKTSVGLDTAYRPRAESKAADFGSPVAGVFGDLYGDARPTGSAAAWSSGAVEVNATTVPPGSTTLVLRSPADAHVRDGVHSGTNFGAAGELEVRLSSFPDNWREAFLRFDLTQVASADQITSATVRLNGRLSQAGSVDLGLFAPSTGGWTEGNLTWDNRPISGTSWIGDLKTLTSTANGWYEFDVTEHLKQQKAAGATSVDLSVKATNYTSPHAIFASDEAAANRPELVVVQASAGGLRQDASGLVSAEAERYTAKAATPTHDWVASTATAGYSGTAAMQSTPNSGNAYAPTYGPRLDYAVEFNRTGTHYVWVRGAGGDAAGTSDSVHVGLDGTVPGTADNANGLPSAAFGWVGSGDAVRLTVEVGSTGLHTLNVFMREDGTIFDKLVVTDDANFTPTGTGPAETR